MKKLLAPLVVALLFSGPLSVAAAPVDSLADAAAALDSGEEALQADALAYLLKKTSKYDVGKYQHRTVIERTEDGGAWAGWIVREPQARSVTVVPGVGMRWPMKRLDGAGHFGLIRRFKVMEGAEYRFDVDGIRKGGGQLHRFGFEQYDWEPDSVARPDVPKGTLHEMGVHRSTQVYPGTERKWWVYEPAGLQAAAAKGQRARLMVVNDGEWFIKGDGSIPTVLDNLIAKKSLPPVVVVFLNPGGTKGERQNRSNEYDTCTPRYASFLEQEILPQVAAKWPVSTAPADRAILGSSSGGSCAFTAGWHRPDLFGNVVSFIGSFADFRPLSTYPDAGKQTWPEAADPYGPWKTAHDYPGLIRKTDPQKPIRVFLQDGRQDLNNQLGHWYYNNLRMVAALDYAGYDYRWVEGNGFHSGKHGKTLLPEIFVWLWGAGESR